MARKGGIGPRGRKLWSEASESAGTYTGTERIQQERNRISEGRGAEFPTTHLTDISPWVYPGVDHPKDESTRVAAFKFIANTEEDDAFLGNRYGTIFVKFIKHGTPWKYANVPQNVYDSFFSSKSKGKFINSALNNYPYGRVTGDEYDAYFNDM